MRRPVLVFLLALLVPLTYYATLEATSAQSGRRVLVVNVSGFIGTATVDQIAAATDAARARDAVAVLMTLDTFGGAAEATFRAVEVIQAAPVPVIGFVYPGGRQALSAGTYLLMASDYAAMAPFTTIGSAQPIANNEPITDAKIVNAFLEKMVSYAELHGRNVTEARRFITANDNLQPAAALRLHVIDAIAETPEELL